ncbi:MAG: transcriptional repressor [Actinobacteria bacterium]|nr:transcriptional repressor [Actinomycetota bacterium]
MTSTDHTRATGPRNTRQRSEIRRAVEDLPTFASAQEIHDRLRHDGSGVGLATVYRTLQAMAAGGELDAIRTPDGQIAYRICSPGHHHHLICRPRGPSGTPGAQAPAGCSGTSGGTRTPPASGSPMPRHAARMATTCSVVPAPGDHGSTKSCIHFRAPSTDASANTSACGANTPDAKSRAASRRIAKSPGLLARTTRSRRCPAATEWSNSASESLRYGISPGTGKPG